MDPAYLENTKGPLTTYLRSRNNKKNKLKVKIVVIYPESKK